VGDGGWGGGKTNSNKPSVEKKKKPLGERGDGQKGSRKKRVNLGGSNFTKSRMKEKKRKKGDGNPKGSSGKKRTKFLKCKKKRGKVKSAFHESNRKPLGKS